MKKRLYLLLTLVLSLFMFCGSAMADEKNMAMWLDCNYKVYSADVDKIETDRPIVFIGGWKNDTDVGGTFRLLNPVTFQEHSPALYTWLDNDNPQLHCWFYSEEDISKGCNDKEAKKYSDKEAQQMLRQGICPAIIRNADGLKANEYMIFAGRGETKNAYYLTNQYRFYKDKNIVYSYGYDINGFFVRTHNGVVLSSYDEVLQTLNSNRISSVSSLGVERYGRSFMNVAELDYSSDFIPKGASLVFDGKNNISNLHEAIDNWYSDVGSSLAEKSQAMSEIESDYKQLITSCTALNKSYDEGKKYKFSGNYTANNMLNDLSNLHNDLNQFYDKYSNEETNKYKMCSSDETTSNASFSAYNCSMIELLGNIDYVPSQLQQFVLADVNKYLTETKNLYLDNQSDDEGILNTAVKCSSYLKKNADDYDFDDLDPSDVADDFSTLGADRGLAPLVYDCESLLGEDLIKKINSYLNIVKIAIPIILIGFGVIDFTKAIFSGEDEMKKAQNKFLKRIFIALLIFLTPTIVNLILTLANMVWSYISPSSCGLF